MKDEVKGILFDIKELTVHDGPGVRATLFFKGCPLRCLWCHNPEGISVHPQLMVTANGCKGCNRCYDLCGEDICKRLGRCVHRCPRGLLKVAGTVYTARRLAERMHRLTPFLINGGITISGGEPLMQPEFLQELLSCLKPLHTVVETSGYARPEVFRMAANACDIIYLDIKHPDSERHRRLTGVGNELILENLRWLKEREQPFLVRIPLIPGCNDDSASLAAAGDLLAGAVNLTGVELMPMNPYAEAKYKMVGMDYPLKSYREKDAAGFVCGSASVSPEEAAAIFTRRGLKSKVLEI